MFDTDEKFLRRFEELVNERPILLSDRLKIISDKLYLFKEECLMNNNDELKGAVETTIVDKNV